MKEKYLKNIFVMVFFLLFSVFLIFYAIPVHVNVARWNTGSIYDGRTFPYLLSYVLAFVSVLGIVSNGISLYKEGRVTHGKNSLNLNAIIRPILVAIWAFAYYFLFDKVGFVIASLIGFPIFLLILRCKKWAYLIYIYGFSFIIFMIFRYVLIIQIP